MSRDHPVIVALRETTRLRPADIDFIVEHGQNYRGVSLPGGVRRFPLGECIPGADEFEARGLGRFVYGFALRPGTRRPIPHAWVSSDGATALDPTLPDPTGNTYWGASGRFYERVQAMIARGFEGVTSAGVPVNLVPGTLARSIMPKWQFRM